MNTLKWFLIRRWQFKKSAKAFNMLYPGAGMDVYVAAIRNNLAGCRDNKRIAKDMIKILHNA